MHDEYTVDRRTFTLEAALAILSGVVITITGCGGGSSSSTTSSTPVLGPGDKQGSISGNHGHSAVITAAQLTAAGALSLNIRGSASHEHTVVLSAAEVASIAGNLQVAKVSTNTSAGGFGDHNHTVTFN